MTMRIAATAGVLATQLGWVAKMLPTRPSIPILAGIRLDLDTDQVRLTGTDYEVWTHAVVEADVQGAGTVVVPGRLLAALLSRLPASRTVVLTIDPDKVAVECGPTKCTVRTMPAEDYPNSPTAPAPAGQVEAQLLAVAVDQVAPAASTDDTLAVLTGVHAVLGKGGIVLSATDRYRLAQQIVPWEPTLAAAEQEQDSELLIPAVTLAQAARAMTGTVTLAHGTDSGTWVCHLDDGVRSMSVRLLSFDYIPVESHLAQAAKGAVVDVEVEVADLDAALGRVSLFAGRNSPISLTLVDGGLVVRAGDDGDDGAEEVAADIAGEVGWTFAMNPQMLAQTLTGARSERVVLHLTSPTRPVLVTPVRDGDPGRQILMPVRQPTASVAAAA
ncbi:DNA polymerase III subunit beta [Nocardiopsis sp. NPDC101807]|uniref:DNA polymerase III subunit beta n=1 Tax=Nocardiopsis sp. NPDC101807 TaxID=3364339 RepID=UPI0037F96A69